MSRDANVGRCQTGVTDTLHASCALRRSGSASASWRRWISSSMPTMSSRRAVQTHVLEDAAPCAPAATLCVRVCVCVLQVKPKAQQSSGLLAPKKGNGDWVMKTPERRRFCLRQGLAQRYWFSQNVGKLPFKSKALAASVGSAHLALARPTLPQTLALAPARPTLAQPLALALALTLSLTVSLSLSLALIPAPAPTLLLALA